MADHIIQNILIPSGLIVINMPNQKTMIRERCIPSALLAVFDHIPFIGCSAYRNLVRLIRRIQAFENRYSGRGTQSRIRHPAHKFLFKCTVTDRFTATVIVHPSRHHIPSMRPRSLISIVRKIVIAIRSSDAVMIFQTHRMAEFMHKSCNRQKLRRAGHLADDKIRIEVF